jgi:signal transduction histidine kinase
VKVKKLSLKRVYFITSLGVAFTIAVMLTALYILTESAAIFIWGLIVAALIAFWIIFFVSLVRKKLVVFSDEICRALDGMMNGEFEQQTINEEESLLAKINYRLTRLYETMRENNRRVAEEKKALQELISDISHQVKTPIANLKMVNGMLLEQNVPEDKQREFLHSVNGQLDKLDFLMQAMIKMSRLETGIITLSQKDCSIYETLAAALGGILFSAESKNINVRVDCPVDLTVYHDSKWTTEALFNILDNSVKYTPSGGTIQVTAVRWEMHTKIDISDTGKGIIESRHAEIFKRFYREEEVHGIEGIGIGLYLAREIIALQGGYIKVASEAGQGSVFSVLLPNK